MYSVKDDTNVPGFPIRTSSDHRLLPPTRSLTQGATSFIASQRLGIHQMLFRHLNTIRIGKPKTNNASLIFDDSSKFLNSLS